MADWREEDREMAEAAKYGPQDTAVAATRMLGTHAERMAFIRGAVWATQIAGEGLPTRAQAQAVRNAADGINLTSMTHPHHPGMLSEDAIENAEVDIDPEHVGLEPRSMTFEHSQAISLKRIADALDMITGRDPSRMGLIDGVMHAIEQGILSGTRR